MNLQPQHLAHLKTSAITPEILEERGYHSITNAAELKHMAPSQRLVPAIGIPTYQLGEHYTTVSRPDHPRTSTSTEGKAKTIKYEWPAQTPLVLDVLPRFRDALTSVDIPLWFTEGAKKADALASHNAVIVPISINGIWGWMEKDGKDVDGNRYLLPDFRRLALRGRRVVLAFDSDYQVNDQVRMALDEFAKALGGLGAIVGILQLAHLDEKLGVDDAFASGWTFDEVEKAIHWREVGAIQVLPQTLAIDKLRHENEQLRERLQWMLAALSNPALPAGQRLSLLLPRSTCGIGVTVQATKPSRGSVVIRKIADESGQSPDVVGRHIKNLEQAGAWKRECRKVPDAKTGDLRTEVRLTTAPVLERPRNIKPPQPKNWGGKRETCASCGSDRLVVKTQVYCEVCGTVHRTQARYINDAMSQVAGSDEVDERPDASEEIAPPAQVPMPQVAGSSETEAGSDISSSPLTIGRLFVGSEPMPQLAGSETTLRRRARLAPAAECRPHGPRDELMQRVRAALVDASAEQFLRVGRIGSGEVRVMSMPQLEQALAILTPAGQGRSV